MREITHGESGLQIGLSSGRLLCGEGMPIRYAYLLQSGMIGISRRDEEGIERISSILHPGDVVGLDDIFRGSRYTNKALALKRTILRAIPSHLLVEAIRSDRKLALRLLGSLAERIEQGEGIQSRQNRIPPAAFRLLN